MWPPKGFRCRYCRRNAAPPAALSTWIKPNWRVGLTSRATPVPFEIGAARRCQTALGDPRCPGGRRRDLHRRELRGAEKRGRLGQSLPQQSRTPSGGPGDPISQEHVAACSGPQERRAGLAGHSERELQLKYLAPRDGPARNSPSEREPICIALFDRGHCLCGYPGEGGDFLFEGLRLKLKTLHKGGPLYEPQQ